MAAKSSQPKLSRKLKAARASVSFASDTYAELERIAESKKVSIAWVIREAAEKYVAEQWPLFSQKE